MNCLIHPMNSLWNRSLYKSIVVAMSVCMPIGIAYGIALNQLPLGLLAGNMLGFLLGSGIALSQKDKSD